MYFIDLPFLSGLHWDGDALMHRWCPWYVWASEVGLWCIFRRVLQDVGSKASPLLDSFYVWRKKHQFTQQHHLQVSLVSTDSVESSTSLGFQCGESAPTCKGICLQHSSWIKMMGMLCVAIESKMAILQWLKKPTVVTACVTLKEDLGWDSAKHLSMWIHSYLVTKIQVSHVGKLLLLWIQSTIACT